MTDRELLEMAAKAAGYNVRWCLNGVEGDEIECFVFVHTGERWIPKDDDGDALRLMVKLRLQVQVNEASIVVYFNQNEVGATREPLFEYPNSELVADYNIIHVNHESATRLAIVRAAAEIGRSMK